MEDKDKTATEANAETIAPQEKVEITPVAEDLEAKLKASEEEKLRILEEATNYKAAYLKEQKKNRSSVDDDEDESIDEKTRRIAHEVMAESRLAEIASEQDSIIKKALKENKELKLALNNKTNVAPTGMGTHSESQTVQDTLVTPEQLAYFKKQGWSDKDIERYKKNLKSRT